MGPKKRAAGKLWLVLAIFPSDSCFAFKGCAGELPSRGTQPWLGGTRPVRWQWPCGAGDLGAERWERRTEVRASAGDGVAMAGPPLGGRQRGRAEA